MGLQYEIPSAEAEVAKADDRQLETMMPGEDSDRRLKSAETALKQAEQSIAAERKDLHTQHAAKKKELDAALAEREPAIAPIPEDLRVLYERIGKRHHGIPLPEPPDAQSPACAIPALP